MLCGGSCATAKALRAAGVCLTFAAAAQGTHPGVLLRLPSRFSEASSAEEHRILEALQGDTLVTSAEPVTALAWLPQGLQDAQTGMPEVQRASGRFPPGSSGKAAGLSACQLVTPRGSWGR